MIALYCRVSTDEQAQHGFSIESQKERLEAYCKSQGLNEYDFYIDDGYTGTNMDRPALKRLVRDIEKGKINTVIVYRLDRLSRKQKDVLYLLEDVFEENNVAFKSATEPFDTSTPFGKAMLGILAVFAQLERDTIVQRATAGRRQRVRKGLWYGGRTPFGYKWNTEKQELEIVPDQADLVRQVFKMFLQGESYLAIAEWLAERTSDRVIDHSVIRDMLQRPIYAGYMINNGVLVKGNHKPIIDMDTFNQVQKEILRRKAGRKPIGKYLLSGLLSCGECGGRVNHVRWKGGSRRNITYDYYVCRNKYIRKKDRTADCILSFQPMGKIDTWIIDKIKKISLDPSSIEAELIKQYDNSNENTDNILESLNESLSDIERKLDKWYDAFEQGILDPAKFKERIDKLEHDKKIILERLDEIDDNIPSSTSIDELINTLSTIGHVWDDMTFDEQRAILRAMIKNITLYQNKDPEIKWNI